MYCIQEEIVQIHDFNAFEHHTHESALEYKGFVEVFFLLTLTNSWYLVIDFDQNHDIIVIM